MGASSVVSAAASVTVVDLIFSATFLAAVIRMTTPILFAALGGLITGRAGVMNIALEGIMLWSALIGVIVSGYTKGLMPDWARLLLALVAGLAVGILIAVMLAIFSIKLKANIILGGIAINMFASGSTVFLMFVLTGDKGSTASIPSIAFPKWDIPLIKDIPFLGEVLSGQNLLTYLAFLSVVFVYLLMFKTPTGLRLRAVGENPDAAESVGIKVNNIKYLSLILSGVFAGLGGLYMSMAYIYGFMRDMVAGRGFIALSAQNLGRSHPIGAMIASFIFGTADALANNLQALTIPQQLLATLPYATTLLALFVYSIARARKINKMKAQR